MTERLKRNTAQRDRDRATIRRSRPPCGICGQAIDYTLPHLDPGEYVVDHIVPITRGGADHISNKQAAHRSCNRTKSDKIERHVLLLCGPPGAGKTTLARSLGVQVYDVDDPEWAGSETLFRAALSLIRTDQYARAVVIRSAPTIAARTSAATLCGATEVQVLDTPLNICEDRIRQRGNTNQPVRTQIGAARAWWQRYEPGDVPTTAVTGAPDIREFVTSRTW